MIRLTRRYQFSASHRLHSDAFSEERNYEVFGKCNNPFGHGHNYVLEVTVAGTTDSKTGTVVNISDLDAFVNHQVLSAYHNKNLNEDLPAFRARVPTTENVGKEIYKTLNAAWNQAFPGDEPHLQKVRIFETDRNIFEVCQ